MEILNKWSIYVFETIWYMPAQDFIFVTAIWIILVLLIGGL